MVKQMHITSGLLSTFLNHGVIAHTALYSFGRYSLWHQDQKHRTRNKTQEKDQGTHQLRAHRENQT